MDVLRLPNLLAAQIIMATIDTTKVIPIIRVIAKTMTPEIPFLIGAPVPNVKVL